MVAHIDSAGYGPGVLVPKDVAALVIRSSRQVAREHFRPNRLYSQADVPAGPHCLTDEWLTQVLCEQVQGARVAAHELGPRVNGTSSRRGLRVAYNDVGSAAGLPEALFTKSAPTVVTRVVSTAASLGRIEAGFYRSARPGFPVEAPTARYAGFDPLSGRHLVIMDDLTVSRSAVFRSIVDDRVGLAEAEAVVDTLAALHARYWNRARFGDWLQPAHVWMERLDLTIDARRRILSGLARGRDVLPPLLLARQDDVHLTILQSALLNREGPQTLLHGDVHPGNWYRTGEGKSGLHDWQCVVRGTWARDVAYAIATHLEVEDRRNWERQLLDRYLERLQELGVERPGRAEAFLAYRQQLPHALMMWLVTLGRYRMQPNLQPGPITIETLRRIGQAMVDLESLKAVSVGRP